MAALACVELCARVECVALMLSAFGAQMRTQALVCNDVAGVETARVAGVLTDPPGTLIFDKWNTAAGVGRAQRDVTGLKESTFYKA